MEVRFLQNFVDLFYPRTCPSCGVSLMHGEKLMCTDCLIHLPKSNYHRFAENPVAKVFWGRTKIEMASALYVFEKGSKYQKLIHKMKYKGHKDIGIELGKMFGEDLSNTSFKFIDTIIPVPLHPRKLRKRGFNQAELIARGLGESLEKPVDSNNLYRKVANPTQTKKNRIERWENVSGIFDVKSPGEIENKHILLVDDVLTTGSTLEACASAFTNIPGIKVSIVVLAYAL
ncbi:MAG: ComF family protein [Bacteroidales bacterium]|nr:ComF family protein [Bacteroidales bacterium]